MLGLPSIHVYWGHFPRKPVLQCQYPGMQLFVVVAFLGTRGHLIETLEANLSVSTSLSLLYPNHMNLGPGGATHLKCIGLSAILSMGPQSDSRDPQ